ncbi:MAG: spore photoproduct lyase family protein [Thermodesulfobacteriota bacterium]
MINEKSTAYGYDPARGPIGQIRRVLVEQGVVDEPHTQRILARLGDIPTEIVADNEMFDQEQLGIDKDFATGLTKGKQTLLLGRNRGRFLKACPATREYRCCDYQVLNIGMNCPMECVYCILQAYLNNPWLSFFVNTDDLFRELTEAFDAEPDRVWRIGTGEFTDSLALDSLTHLSRDLVSFIRDKPKAVLELKTKTDYIENLKNLEHNGRTIVAWSLNSPPIMQKEELKTASLDQRLTAAAECAKMGYKLAFHFDPIIHHPSWREGYRQTIKQLFASVPAESIVWISMGALRFLPSLKNIATSRFPNSRFFYNEFVLGLDNKFRYFRTLRVEMYKLIYEELKKYAAANTCIYMCMESDEIWQEVFGYTPEEYGGLPTMLDRAAGLVE